MSLGRFLRVPNYCAALWSSVAFLVLGLALGAYVMYSASYAIMLLVVGIFFYLEMKRATQRIFLEPVNHLVVGSASRGPRCADDALL